jgi:hypothetical protein
MSLIERFIKARDKPQNSILGNTYSFFFGSTPSGKTVNERTALQTSAVYACVRILSETIASLPLHTYRYTDRGKDKALDHPLYYLLHSEPNREMTSFVFRETLMSQGRSFQRLNELYAANGQVGFRATQRVDGKLILPESIQILQMKT